MLCVTSLSTFLLVFKTTEEWPRWSDDREATSIEVGEKVSHQTLEPVPQRDTHPPLLETLQLETSVQSINQSAISKPTNSLPVCVLILACDRPKELNIALTSWSKLSGLPVTISMDCESHESDVVVADWLSKQPLWSKMDSFQRLIKEPPSEETITRHWVSALTIMFQRPECDYVIYAEEDHIVSDDFFDSAKTLISAFDMCPTCWSMNMGCHRDCWGKRENNPSAVIRMESGNMGVIYTREGFQTFMNHIDTFCDMLGNWDNNVHTMATIGHIKPHSLTFLQPRIHHLTTCHSSRTGVTHIKNCDWSKETADFFSKERRLHEPLVDRGVALFRPGAKTYARAPALTKQRCLAAASATVPEQTTTQVLSKKGKPIPKIAVAIPTYNRAGYVQLCAAALNKTLDPNDVWIFDDHSTEYTADDLQEWFHTENVEQNTERFKADKQARHILEWFVGTDYDWLITLDSDLIVRPDWLELLRWMLSRTQGVMSLYHSGNPNHPTLHCDPNLCEMKSLGNAGVAWSAVLAKRMLVDMTQSDGFDWGWTEWLRKQKIPQYAAKDSLVLHVGMHGTWGADSKREKSVGFPMDKLSPDVRGRAELFLKGMQ